MRYLVLQFATKIENSGTNINIIPGGIFRFVDADNKAEAIGIFSEKAEDDLSDCQKSSIECFDIEDISILTKDNLN